MTSERMKPPQKKISLNIRCGTAAFEDMFAAFLISYALMSFGYEKYMPAPFMEIWNYFVFLLFAATWIVLSFKNGLKKSFAFPIFAVLFFMLPELAVFLANDGPRVFRMSVIMYVISEFCALIVNSPLRVFTSEAKENSHIISSVICAAVCVLSYAAGVIATNKRKGNYTPKRC